MHIFQTMTKDGGGGIMFEITGAESAFGGAQVLSQKDILKKIEQIWFSKCCPKLKMLNSRGKNKTIQEQN